MKPLFVFAAAIFMGVIATSSIAAPGDGRMNMRDNQPLTRAEVIARVKERFTKLDTNKDGYLTQAEIDARRNEVMDEQNERRFKALDDDKDGKIDREEFDKGRQEKMDKNERRGDRADRGSRSEGGGMMFKRLDVNNDGKITLAEMTNPALARFDAIDTNKDSTISIEERRAGRVGMMGRRP